MCNVDTEEVLNANLLPGYMRKCPCSATFKTWLKFRYSCATNTMARQLRGVQFGQGNRILIDKSTHMLSLSDCYWTVEENEDLLFEDVSPYYQDFWQGVPEYKGESIPTLYVNGALPKMWLDRKTLLKTSVANAIEYECIKLAHLVGVCCEEAYLSPKGLKLINFTSPDVMLEQLDMSGFLTEDNYCDEDFVKLFGLQAVQMLTLDAIFGNGDRHLGNVGFLRNTLTGEYLGMAPLYDFDHALDSTSKSADRLITDLVEIVSQWGIYAFETIRICNDIISNSSNEIFKYRAEIIKKEIEVWKN